MQSLQLSQCNNRNNHFSATKLIFIKMSYYVWLDVKNCTLRLRTWIDSWKHALRSSFRSSLGPRLPFVWNHSSVVSNFHVWNSYGHYSTWKPIFFYGMQERRLNGKIIDNPKFMYFCNATSRKVLCFICSKKQETKLKSMFPLGSRAFAFLLFELKARKYNASILMLTSKRSPFL